MNGIFHDVIRRSERQGGEREGIGIEEGKGTGKRA